VPCEEVPRGDKAFGVSLERLLDGESTVRREEAWTPDKDLEGSLRR